MANSNTAVRDSLPSLEQLRGHLTPELKNLQENIEHVLTERAAALRAELASIKPKRTRGPNKKPNPKLMAAIGEALTPARNTDED